MTTKPLSPHTLGVIRDTITGLMDDLKTIRTGIEPRCRYLNRDGVQCTAEAVDPVGEVLLCTRHLGLALEMISYHYKRRQS